jgi:antirestriction protein ArdC
LPAHYYNKPEPLSATANQKIERVEAFLKNTRAIVRHRGDRAYYTQQHDLVQMPALEAFKDPESYYATLAHEVIHWTKHPDRLDRDFGRKKWGDEGYAREELVAELGSAFLCADLNITPEVRADHAAYIGSWLQVLKNDQRAIFSAAAHAQKAVDYLHTLQSAGIAA